MLTAQKSDKKEREGKDCCMISEFFKMFTENKLGGKKNWIVQAHENNYSWCQVENVRVTPSLKCHVPALHHSTL